MKDRFVVVAALALAGCAPRGPAYTPALPSLDAVIGGAPAQGDIPDDVKADGPLPSKFTDLIAQQSPIRSQGMRGVCTIFTATALLEHLTIQQGHAAPDYSEQFTQWSQKNEAAHISHGEASSLGEVMGNLATNGTVDESLWRYDPETWSSRRAECNGPEAAQPMYCFTDGDAPAAALTAPRIKMPLGRYLRSSSIKDYLVQHHTAVGVGLDFIASAWSYPPDRYTARPNAWERGEIPFPSDAEIAAAQAEGSTGHAVLIVGWDDEHTVPVLGDDGRVVVGADGQPVQEKGFYIVKNSWGTDYWGAENPYGAGYGLLSERYVERFGHAFVVGLPTGAPLPPDGVTLDGKSNLPIAGGGETDDSIVFDDDGPLTAGLFTIAIHHPNTAALSVLLVHDNTTWMLWDHSPSQFPIIGRWTLNGLDRIDRGGTWTLKVSADGGAAAGEITSWSLTLK